jgi:hypothetical protein
MDSAKYLARIDSLCSAGHSESDVVMAGPGYRVASLEVSHGPVTGDAAELVQAVEDFHALKDHIAQRLDERWGAQQPRWGMQTLRIRSDRGEEIPEPWATVSAFVDELDLWQAHDGTHWIALGVADRDQSDEVQLLAVVTDIDPP